MDLQIARGKGIIFSKQWLGFRSRVASFHNRESFRYFASDAEGQTKPTAPTRNNSISKTDTDPLSINESQDNTTASKSSTLGFVSAVLVIGGLVGLSIVYKEDLQNLLQAFTAQVKGMGVRGYFAYAGAYVVLETIALPATPLTLAAGYLFGVLPGVCVVSISSTIAATLAFLISRYLLREKVTEFFSGSKQFLAIDRATEKDGFRIVFLLRLSPLLPFAASNYLYGLTSVPVLQYVVASWIGMLPGTWAYISAGDVGRQVVDGSSTGLPPWEIVAGFAVTVAVLLFTGNIARKALKEIEQEG